MTMAVSVKPKALIVPIIPRSSLTILLIVVEHTSAAIAKKNIGNTAAMPSTILESLSKQT